MRFTSKYSTCGSERIGSLTGFVKSSTAVIETPTAALLTQAGSVVHLTAEVLAKVFTNPQLLWMPLASTIHLEPGVKAQGEGVAKFTASPEHVICATLNNINDSSPLGHFEQEKVPLWTKNGKKMITAEKFMDLMEVFKPDIILAIADSRVSLSETNKRVVKSVNRTCTLLDKCVNRYKGSTELRNSALIGVVVGASSDYNCNNCIKNIIKHKEVLGGVALSGITDGTDDSYKMSSEKLESIFKKVGEALPKDLVHFVEGCWNPAVIVTAIKHGWDIFDGSYPLKLTSAGQALALHFDVDRNSDELCILDLNDEQYKEDFRPVLEGCECLTCRKHTRAYIRHLLNTREMLSSVLLSIHNLHHFDQLFHHARRHIASNTYEVYKNHIIKQYEGYTKIQLEDNKNSNENHCDKDDSCEIINSKKIKVSHNVLNVVNGSQSVV